MSTQDYTLPNGPRVVSFSGTKLAEASSHQEGKPRWFEVTLYLTDGGTYVVAGAGRTTVAGERDREWATVCDDAAGVVKRLMMHDESSGQRYLPRTSQQLLVDASRVDDGIRSAYTVEVVD